ncbi:hypothetical protein Syun_018769 [Stephania yunnanensis]|uniref:Uncharacterized protein n=1 Tax=Stephania yunnanensis TaxID=152371 RepID=A0AAP0ISV7_9MAGN
MRKWRKMMRKRQSGPRTPSAIPSLLQRPPPPIRPPADPPPLPRSFSRQNDHCSPWTAPSYAPALQY